MAYSPEDLRKLGNISVSTPSGFETEYKGADFHMSEKEAIAYAREMGASDSIRGLKQMYGNITNQTDLLEALEKKDKKLKTIFKNPEFGNKAFQNYLGYAVVADPVGYIPIVGWAKKSKSLFDAAKYGVGMGGAYGAMAYVGEGESRALNATVGATAGGLLGLGTGALINKVNKKVGQTPMMPSVKDTTDINLDRRVEETRQNKNLTQKEIEAKTQSAVDEVKDIDVGYSRQVEKNIEDFYKKVGSEKLWNQAVQNWGSGLVGIASGVGGYNAFNDPDSTQMQKVTAGLLFALGGVAGTKAIGKLAYKDTTVAEMFSQGIVDNYGLPKQYTQLVKESFGDVNQLSNQFIEIINKTQRLSMDERKTLYGMITGEIDDVPDLIGFKKEARDIMTSTGKAMVDAGLLSEKVFNKNVDKYIHRSYMKHVIGTDGNPEAYSNARKMKIVGDELKPRGKELPNPILKTTYERSLKKESKNFGAYNDYEIINIRTSLSEAQYNKFNKKITKGKTFNFNKDIKDIRDWEVKGQGADGRYILEDTKRIKLRRDLTKEERLLIGEIEDASFAIAETGRLMTNDLSIYKLYENIAADNTLSKSLNEYQEALTTKVINEDDWVQVSGDTLKNLAKVDNSYIRKYGQLSNKYVPKEVFDDLTRINSLKEGEGAIMENYLGLNRLWKKSKTAWNPVVHVNNTVSNVILYDLAGANVKFMGKGFKELRKGIENADDSELYKLAESYGVFESDIVTKELTKQTGSALQEVMNKLGNPREPEIVSATNYAKKAFKTLGDKTFGKLTDLYQLEDQAFRMGLFMDRLNKGMKPAEAAADAKKWFIDYDINAPWVNTMRRFPTPFLSYTYRVVPLLGEAAVKRPWKFAKWSLLGYGLNEAGKKLGPGNEEEERLVMREQFKQRLFGMPFLSKTTIKTPFSSGKDSFSGEERPLYVDVKRFIPGGDVFAIGEKGIGIPIPFTDKSVKLPSTLAPNFGALGEIFIPMITGVDPFTFRKLEGLGLGNDDKIKFQHVISRLLPNVPSSAFTVPLMGKPDSPLEKYNPFAQTFGSKKIRKAYRQAVTEQESRSGTNFTELEALLSVFGFKAQPVDVTQLLGIKGMEFQRKYAMARTQFYRISKRVQEGVLTKEEGEEQINNIVTVLEKEYGKQKVLLEDLEKARAKKTEGGYIEGPEVPQTMTNPADRINSETGLPFQERRTFATGGSLDNYTPLENEMYQIQVQAESNLSQPNLYAEGIAKEARKPFKEGKIVKAIKKNKKAVQVLFGNKGIQELIDSGEFKIEEQAQYQMDENKNNYITKEGKPTTNIKEMIRLPENKNVNVTPEKFVKLLYDRALKLNIPHPSVVAVQGGLESSYGTSNQALGSNNFHGVKSNNPSTEDHRVYPTREERKDKTSYNENAPFLHYNSIDESLMGYYNQLKTRVNDQGELRYGKALQAKDNRSYVQGLKDAGYATDNDYVDSIMKLHDQYNHLFIPQ